MGISYTSLNAEAMDTPVQLLGKIIQRLGTFAALGDNETVLLRKLLTALNTAASGAAGTNSSGDFTVSPFWTDGAVHTGLKVNVTDISSAAASRYVDFQVGGVSQFYLDKATGATNVVGTLLTNGYTQAQISDANNTTQPTALEVYHALTSGVGAANMGVSIDFKIDGSATQHTLTGRISSVGTNPGTPFVVSTMGFWIFNTGTLTKTFEVNPAGVDLPSGSNGVYRVAGTQVVGTRKPGWTAATGTATRTTFATGTVTLSVLAEHVKALQDDLTSHGLIGT